MRFSKKVFWGVALVVCCSSLWAMTRAECLQLCENTKAQDEEKLKAHLHEFIDKCYEKNKPGVNCVVETGRENGRGIKKINKAYEDCKAACPE